MTNQNILSFMSKYGIVLFIFIVVGYYGFGFLSDLVKSSPVNTYNSALSYDLNDVKAGSTVYFRGREMFASSVYDYDAIGKATINLEDVNK